LHLLFLDLPCDFKAALEMADRLVNLAGGLIGARRPNQIVLDLGAELG